MYSYSVNDIFEHRVNIVQNDLVPLHFVANRETLTAVQDIVGGIVNDLGRQSAYWQGLKQPITSVDKVMSTNHTLYLLKDEQDNLADGKIVGLLKTGTKKLYFYDTQNRLITGEPLCVLDFFVLGEYQRQGCGKELFDFMLKDKDSTANKLAIDGPSPKMENFLRKHYGLKNLHRQANNFSIDTSFFEAGCTEASEWKTQKLGPDQRMVFNITPGYGRLPAFNVINVTKKISLLCQI